VRLIPRAAPFFLGLAVATGVQARTAPVTIHMKAVRGQIEIFYRGQKLTDSKFAKLCAASRGRKADISFQRDKMNSGDTVSALLREADCMGAARKGPTRDGRRQEQKSSARTHAKHPRAKGSPL
jgi:hypothetical protein